MNEATETTRRLIEDTLGDSAAFRSVGDDLYVVKQGSALVVINVLPWGDDRAVVRCFSPVVKGARMDEALAVQLLRLNAHLRFGAFAYLPDERIVFFLHSILGGETLDSDELSATVRDVALVADEYDNRIIDKFGGKTMRDLVEEDALKNLLASNPDAFRVGRA